MNIETTHSLLAALLAASLTACVGSGDEDLSDAEQAADLAMQEGACDENTDPNCPPPSGCENADPNCASNAGDPNQSSRSNTSPGPSNAHCQVLHTDACHDPQTLADAADSVCAENGLTATDISVSAGPLCANNANRNSNASTYDQVTFCCE